jgi:hypothetical protein
MVVLVNWWGQSRGGPSGGGGGLIFFSYCKMFAVRHVRRTVIF